MDDNDMKLIIECSDTIEFHYGDRCSVILVDKNAVEFVKQKALIFINQNFGK